MAYFSGWAAAVAQASGEHPEMLGRHINEGVADGFRSGVPLALAALIIVVWS